MTKDCSKKTKRVQSAEKNACRGEKDRGRTQEVRKREERGLEKKRLKALTVPKKKEGPQPQKPPPPHAPERKLST